MSRATTNVHVPAGFQRINPLNKPISSSSVQGSLRTSSSLSGELSAGVGVLGCTDTAGDVACETRARFLGGILAAVVTKRVQLCRKGLKSAQQDIEAKFPFRDFLR